MAKRSSHEQSKSRFKWIGDVIVFAISIVILYGGWIAWKVWDAGVDRNDYELALETYNETKTDFDKVVSSLQKTVDKECPIIGNEAEPCASALKALEAAKLEKPKTMPRWSDSDDYKAEAQRLRDDVDVMVGNVEKINSYIEPLKSKSAEALAAKVGPQLTALNESVKRAEGEIDACQHVLDMTEGKVADESLRSNQATLIKQMQDQVDAAKAMRSLNPSDYANATAKLDSTVEEASNANVYLKEAYTDWAIAHGEMDSDAWSQYQELYGKGANNDYLE